MLTKENGSMQAGPSNLYLRLLRGEISAKEYAEHVKRNVHRQLGKRGRTSSAAKRAAS